MATNIHFYKTSLIGSAIIFYKKIPVCCFVMYLCANIVNHVFYEE
jgi:hypothetical protein